MNVPVPPLPYTSQPISPQMKEILPRLQSGQRLRITQIVRVGLKSWPAVVTGTFRHVDSLATGLATERVPEDAIIIPIVHFTKDNGELSSVTLDEQSRIEILEK